MVKTTPTRFSLPDTIGAVDQAMAKGIAELAALQSSPCFSFLTDDAITEDSVSAIYEDLRERYGDAGERLTVVVHNGGGDINAAFNLANLFRRYGGQVLDFVVPRWAKSAATLLVCAGDRILMAPPAELGPLDPQIHAEDEEHVEHFSPIHISSALALIRDEYRSGNEKFADALMRKLQFPLTLGSYMESLKIGEVYLEQLLSSRMLKGESAERVKQIATKLSQGYTDHSYCIGVQECHDLGLKVEELSGDALETSWRLFRLCERRQAIQERERRRRMAERIKKLPPELLKGLPVELLSAQVSRCQLRDERVA